MAYWIDGSGPITVLAIHGICGAKEQWILRKPAGATLIAIDRLGYGGSSPVPEGGYDYAEVVADLTELLDALGVAKLAVIGHGVGGGIALALAACLGERVRGVALLAANTDFQHSTLRAKEQCKIVPQLVYRSVQESAEKICTDISTENEVRTMWRDPKFDWAGQFERCCLDGGTETWVEKMRQDSFFACAITDASAKLNSATTAQSDMRRHFFGKFPVDINMIGVSSTCHVIIRCSAADSQMSPAYSEQTKKVIPDAQLDVLPATGDSLDGGGMGHMSLMLGFSSFLLALENVCETEFQEEIERCHEAEASLPSPE